jgi:hypothetical protein
VDKLAERGAGQPASWVLPGCSLFRVSRILPVKKLRAKFEIGTNVRRSGRADHLWRPKPSVHLATPRKNSFDRGGFGKTAKIYG